MHEAAGGAGVYRWQQFCQKQSREVRRYGGSWVALGAVLQAGHRGAMAQLELLWAAAVLMLLGAAVSACVRCQLSGKVLPWARGPRGWPGGCFHSGVSPQHGGVLGASSSGGCRRGLGSPQRVS